MPISARLPARIAVAAAALVLASCGGGGGGGSKFRIKLQFETEVTNATQLAAFNGAKERIEQLITAGERTSLTFHGELCPPDPDGISTQYPVTGSVDNLLILVEVKPVDGRYNVLAASGPCYTRQSNGHPVVGSLTFDEADLAAMSSETMETVILHEMLHVLGFGTIWTDKGLLDQDTCTVASGHVSCPVDADPRFLGTATGAAFKGSSGGTTDTVPVEATGGDGTALSHWRESVFKNELMTGWISGSTQPLSRATAASLADLGYSVDLGKADSFNLSTAANARALESGAVEAPVFVGQDTLPTRPIPVDDSSGQVP